MSSLQVGAYLQASQAGFSLVSTTHMWIAASPKETELTYVRAGQTVAISVDTYPDVDVERHGLQHQPGFRLQLLAAARPEHHRQLGQGRPAHPHARQH